MNNTINMLREDIEYIIHCDESGNIIGPLSKEHAHIKGPRQILTHYSTWAMVYYHASGTYGIQLKNIKLFDATSSNKWDLGIGGHNCYEKIKNKWVPMSYQQTLIKEADEEIGMQVEIFDSLDEFLKQSKKLKKPIAYFFDKFHHKTERNNEYIGFAFILTPNKNVEFKDNEVIDFKWLSPSELEEFIRKNPELICDALMYGFEKAEKFRTSYLN